MLIKLVDEKTNLSLIEISDFVESEILKQKCLPTFKNYHGFPAACCISVNNQLVHGIPTGYKLIDGDVVTFDFGATYNTAIADSATTCIFGQPKSKNHIALLDATKGALAAGIAAAKVGNKIGAIGNAVNKYSISKGFKPIEEYGGHGISPNKVHSDPFIHNKSNPNDGIRIQPGLVIAIEPMLVPFGSSIKTKKSDNGWDIYTDEIGSHEEHTIYITETDIEIITAR